MKFADSQLATSFARRLRANADHAERQKFSVCNLSTLPIADARALAALIDAASVAFALVGKPAAWLKTWAAEDGTGVLRRVDLHPECEPWLEAMHPAIIPLTAPGEKAAVYIEAEVLAELRKHKDATGVVCSGLLRKPFGNPVPLFDRPPAPGEMPDDAVLLALPCEEQHRLAKLLAENVGYVLAEEPEHPDSPHRAAPGRPALEAKAAEFDSEGIPYAAADDPRIEPLKVAIEGECDGLMISNESARMILGHMDHETILSGVVPTERFFLSTDNDSHWYLVPVAKAAEWEEWSAIPEDDERAWDAPDFAKPLGGALGLVTFVDPQLGDTTSQQPGGA